MKKESSAIDRLCDETSKVSAHYFIKKDGSILKLVPDLYEAWHAGRSNWKKDKFLNKYSIGIEIQNSGHDNNYEKFSSKQIYSTKKLLRFLMKLYNINYKNILGHSDIAPDRKKDPGEKFPWKEFADLNIIKWHNLDEKKLKQLRSLKLDIDQENIFLKKLNEIGYNKIESKNFIRKKKNIIKAFQRKFRPNLINGLSDKECLLISKSLLKT